MADVPEGFPMRLPKEALVGLDGLEPEVALPGSAQAPSKPPPTPLTLSNESAARLRAEIERAGGREVCFLARVDEGRVVREPRAVARGNFGAVLVAARDADDAPGISGRKLGGAPVGLLGLFVITVAQQRAGSRHDRIGERAIDACKTQDRGDRVWF